MSSPAGSLRGAYLWATLGQGTSLVLVMLLDVARARLVSPAELGLFVTGMWLLGLIQVVGDAGLGSVLLQEKDLDSARLAALYRVGIGLAIATTVVMLLGAALMAMWTGRRGAGAVSAALVPAVLLSGIAAFPRAVLARGLDFRTIARSEIAASVVQLTTTVGLALLSFGVWSLVSGALATQATRLILLRRRAGPIWSSQRDSSQLPRQVRLAIDITGSRGLCYAYLNGDYFVLSRAASPEALASYFNAFRLATLPGVLVNNVLQQVSFAAFAVSKDREELRARFLSALRLAAIAAFPVSLGLIVTADLLVRALYGAAWVSAGPVLRLLAIMGLSRSLQIIGPSLLLAQGRTRTNLLISVAYAALLVPAFVIGARHGGGLGVAVAWAVVGAPMDLGVLLLSVKSIGISLRQLITLLLRPAALSGCMALAALGARHAVSVLSVRPGSLASVWLSLAAAVAVGGAVYIAMTAWFEPDLREKVTRSIRVGAGRS